MADRGQRWEPLGNGTAVLVDDIHGFGTDALLLAAFAAPSVRDMVCDLGTGCGILPLLWCRDGLASHITAIELQPSAAKMAQESILRGGQQNRVTVLCADLREIPHEVPRSRFDLVTINPPYYPANHGPISPRADIAMARHELTCSPYDAAKAAGELLRTGGRFCLCHRPWRLCDVLGAMHKARLEPKRLRFVHSRSDRPPFLFLVEGKKDGAQGLSVNPPLILTDDNGCPTAEQRRLYGPFRAGDTLPPDTV